MFCTAGVAQPCEISAGNETGLIASALPADGTPAARFHARISARPAFKAATQNLADFTGLRNAFSRSSRCFKSGSHHRGGPRQRPRDGSLAPYRYARDIRSMSASHPKAAQPPHRNETTRCATRVITRRSKKYRYSITSSARASSVGGASRPIAFAAFKLITSSYLTGA
jgi:hypothetical protein